MKNRDATGAREVDPQELPETIAEQQHSAGGLVVDGDRILLIESLRGHRWQLPKGRLEPGETAREAALREIHEETGVRGRVHSYLGAVQYGFSEDGRTILKRVDYYLVEYVGGDPSSYSPEEVSTASWFSFEEGIRRLTFDNERELAEEARRRVVKSKETKQAATSLRRRRP